MVEGKEGMQNVVFCVCVWKTTLLEWNWWLPAQSPRSLGSASETLAPYYEVFSYLSMVVSRSVFLPRSTCLSHVFLITKPATACRYMRWINYCWRLRVFGSPPVKNETPRQGFVFFFFFLLVFLEAACHCWALMEKRVEAWWSARDFSLSAPTDKDFNSP